jgi:tartrate-resistant acid phosphatase type 5
LAACSPEVSQRGECTPAAEAGRAAGESPAPPAPRDPQTPSLHFFALGDTGTGDQNQAAVADAMADFQRTFAADFALLLGDNFYQRGVRSTADPQWRTKFEAVYDPVLLDIPFYAVLGNHDYRRDEEAQVAYTVKNPGSRWVMPDRYYSFLYDLPDGTRIELFGIDTNTILEEDVQLAWLDTALSTSLADWKIVFGHHVLYSYGHYGSDRKRITRLEELFVRAGVDLYLAGHEHHLQILEPISGVSYLTSGAGGRTRESRCGPGAVYAAGLLGFMAFEAARDRLVVFVVLAEGGVDFAYTLPRE